MTNVDLCEDEKKDCDACEVSKSHLLHLSTDFVFDGKSGPYTENDKPNPLHFYAKSKLKSEEIVNSSEIEGVIVRTILVYGKHTTPNIATWLYEKLKNNERLNFQIY